MPTGTVLLAESPRLVEEAAMTRLRGELLGDLGLNREDFYVGGPLRVVRSRRDSAVPTSGNEQSVWIEVNLCRAYFSPEYPRGDIDTIVQCAEWLETHLPGCRIWYGHDMDDDNLAPFTPERRRALLEYAEGSEPTA